MFQHDYPNLYFKVILKRLCYWHRIHRLIEQKVQKLIYVNIGAWFMRVTALQMDAGWSMISEPWGEETSRSPTLYDIPTLTVISRWIQGTDVKSRSVKSLKDYTGKKFHYLGPKIFLSVDKHVRSIKEISMHSLPCAFVPRDTTRGVGTPESVKIYLFY